MNYRSFLAEFLGTALLLLTVVGSGIMGEKLSAGNVAVALLANAIATGAGLYVLITIFGPISGAHFNPVVTTHARIIGEIKNADWLGYLIVQIAGAMVGVLLSHLIFELPLLQISEHSRDGIPQMASEVIATLGLLLVIGGFSRFNAEKIPMGVALYIVGAYWFTSSTSFANPAVSIARSFTNTFAGIAPHSLWGYVIAQFAALGLYFIIEPLLFERQLVKSGSSKRVAETKFERSHNDRDHWRDRTIQN